MTAPVKIELETAVNMTSKGQVLVPKSIRDKLGLMPGQRVRVGINDRGEAVVLPMTARETGETPDERRERVRKALASIAGQYRTGQSTDDYMREIRGDFEP